MTASFSSPGVRGIGVTGRRQLDGTLPSFWAYTYVAQAMYDATIVTWESKYHYDRARPSELDYRLPTALPVPNSPSYPSEHAATAQAAAEISNRTYRVQYSGNLSPNNWTDLAGDVSATSATASKTDTTLSDASQRFYRVLLVP